MTAVQIPAGDWVAILRAKPYIRPAEWIRLSGEASSSVYSAIAQGHLPSIRLGERGIAIPTRPLLALLGADAGNSEGPGHHAGAHRHNQHHAHQRNRRPSH